MDDIALVALFFDRHTVMWAFLDKSSYLCGVGCSKWQRMNESGGQHRDDEVTRTEPVGWTRTRTHELRRIAHQRKQRDCAAVGVCAKGIKKELKTLDEADFVRDVDKSASHHQSEQVVIFLLAAAIPQGRWPKEPIVVSANDQ
jgi:hypothetical protein